TQMWDRLTAERYGVTDPKARRFRYGVQVNSLGLTEQQPENNILRIVLEMLAVTLSRDARARAVQLPAWNEALGLPRPWDQQWSLRAQQILAHETDLLEYGDLFGGNRNVQAKVDELVEGAWSEIQVVLSQGGAVEAVESGYIKQRLVESNARRLRAIEDGKLTVVGVNAFTEGEPSPLVVDGNQNVLTVDPAAEAEQVAQLERWRRMRDIAAVSRARDALRRAAERGDSVMPSTILCAKAGMTTGEWAGALREVLGEYRAPTGVAAAQTSAGRAAPVDVGGSMDDVDSLRMEMKRLERELGRRPRILVGKPGLDGHSNGAEQIAIKARDVGFDVVYEGIRAAPEHIVKSAVEEGVHLVGLSILSGSHRVLVADVLKGLRAAGLERVPVVVGGIIPKDDADALRADGVARVFTPKDFELSAIMRELVELIHVRASS
ncbi:MAG: cobalamin-dependent protein, partial [Myxococcales bacterium]|nr:cobalamin-dependent protein [Myxococcales bacterium]